jgi:hypothetical protein
MNPANLLITNAPAAQPLPAEPALSTQPVTTGSDRPFAKIMEGTVAETPTEPVPKKKPQEGDGDQKKDNTAVALLATTPVSAPVVLPVVPLPLCSQTQSTVKTDVAATNETNAQSSNLAGPIQIAFSTPSVVSTSPAVPCAPATPSEPAAPEATTAAGVSTGLPSVAPAPIAMPAASLPVDAPSIAQQAVPEQTREDSHAAVVPSTTESQTSQLSEGVVPRGLSAIQIQIPQTALSDGTVIAKENDSMKRDVKADKNSAPAEKTLPRGNFSTITKVEATRPSRNREAFSEAFTESDESSRESSVPSEKTTTVYGTAMAEFKHFDVKFSPDEMHVDGVRAPQAEKVLNGISEQVVAFKKVGVNSMDAILRPDGGTEISLHLSLRSNGQVDVVARVERGDFEGLQAHWTELQSSLGQQGIRVGELHQSTLNHQTSSHDPSQHLGTATGEQQQAQRQAFRSPETLDELPLVGSVTEPLKGRASTPTAATRRGWEKWA